MLNRQRLIGSVSHENVHDTADKAIYRQRREKGVSEIRGVDKL